MHNVLVNKPKFGTKAHNLIDRLEFYREELARIEVTEFPKFGIISVPFYYKIRRSNEMIPFETACYLALCFFGIFLSKGKEANNRRHEIYIGKHSSDILNEVAQEYITAFRTRSGLGAHPLSTPLSVKQKIEIEKQILTVLDEHDKKFHYSARQDKS